MENNVSQSKFIAELLLKHEAVFLRPHDPFTWASGIKSPIYCDNRLLFSHPEAREKITEAFIDKISPLKPDTIAGTATAGIPWASFIAYQMKLPLIYIRSSSKDHGRQNAIEGKAKPGSKILLIEDLISTGKSSLAACEKIQEVDLELLKVFSIFSYELPEAEAAFNQKHINYDSLCNFDTLAEVAYNQNQFNESTLKDLLEWRKGKKIYE
jgi:orotate phosphoribosyltransferase